MNLNGRDLVFQKSVGDAEWWLIWWSCETCRYCDTWNEGPWYQEWHFGHHAIANPTLPSFFLNLCLSSPSQNQILLDSVRWTACGIAVPKIFCHSEDKNIVSRHIYLVNELYFKAFEFEQLLWWFWANVRPLLENSCSIASVEYRKSFLIVKTNS